MRLSTLLNEADVVVVASVNDVSAARPVRVDLTVQRILKGSMLAMTAVTAELAKSDTTTSELPSFTRELSPGKTGIWFLRQIGASWRVLPLGSGDVAPNFLYIHVPRGDLPTACRYDPATDPKKKLLLELEAAALNPETADAVARLALMRMLDDGLGVDNLKSFDVALASSSEMAPKAIGIAGAVRAGEPSSLAKIAAMSRAKLSMTEQGILLMAVCDYRGTDPASVPELANLAESASVPRMKECAAHALREIHTKEAVPFLLKLPRRISAMMRRSGSLNMR